jgi:hypothetical protein
VATQCRASITSGVMSDRLEVKLPILCRLHARAVNLAVRAAVAAGASQS